MADHHTLIPLLRKAFRHMSGGNPAAARALLDSIPVAQRTKAMQMVSDARAAAASQEARERGSSLDWCWNKQPSTVNS